jgi:ligand-binding sensor domain-containing protein
LLVSKDVFTPFTRGGDSLRIVKYNGQSFINYATVPQALYSLATGYLDLRTDSNNNKWVFSNYCGIFKYDGSTWSIDSLRGPLLKGRMINTSFVDNNGNVWIGSTGDTLIKYNSQKVSRTTLSNSLMPFTYFTSFCVDKSGTRWFLSTRGLLSYNDTSWSYYDYTNSSLPYGVYEQAIIDKDDNLWIAINSAGSIYKFNTQNRKIESILLPPGRQIIYDIAQDLNGNIWTGYADIFCYNGSTWTTHSFSPVSDNASSSICVDKLNNIWASSASGLAKYNGSTWTTYTGSNSPITRACYLSVDSSNNIWGDAYENNLFRFDGNNKWTLYDTTQIGTFGYGSAYVDKKGAVWILTSKGVAIYDGTGWKFPFNKGSGLQKNRGLPLGEDRNGDMWFSISNGLAVLKTNPATETSFRSACKSPSRSLIKNKAFVFFSKSITIEFNQSFDPNMIVGVYDISGHKTGTPTVSEIGNSKFKIHWNGYNSFGRKVAHGIYFIRFTRR